MFDIFYGGGRNTPNGPLGGGGGPRGPLGLMGSRECRCTNPNTGEIQVIGGCSRIFNMFKCVNCCRTSLGENWTGQLGFQRYGNRI